MIDAYPLQWPAGWPRTASAALKPGKFGTMKRLQGRAYNTHVDITIAEAVQRVLDELARMGVDRKDVVISTNLELRQDGLPLSKQRALADEGAAVYWNGRVMAIDQYYRVADNLAAIAATLEAMRAIERHGGAQILDRAFTGFTALPAPTAKRHWREVFGYTSIPEVTRSMVRAAYRRLAFTHHPDRPGGSHAAMSELNVALAEAEKELVQDRAA